MSGEKKKSFGKCLLPYEKIKKIDTPSTSQEPPKSPPQTIVSAQKKRPFQCEVIDKDKVFPKRADNIIYECYPSPSRSHKTDNIPSEISKKTQNLPKKISNSFTIFKKNKNLSYFLSLFEDYFEIENKKDLYGLISQYFGNYFINDESLSELRGIIEFYEYTTEKVDLDDLIELFKIIPDGTKVEELLRPKFFESMGNLLLPYEGEDPNNLKYLADITRGRNINKKGLSRFLTGKERSYEGGIPIFKFYRIVKYNLKTKLKDKNTDRYKEALIKINSLRNYVISNKENPRFTCVSEALQDLYASFLNDPNKVGFTTEFFSKMIYGLSTANYITSYQNQNYSITGEREWFDRREMYLGTLLRLENLILNIDYDEVDKHLRIDDIDDFKKFRIHAVAMLRLHYLRENFIHINSIHEASILLRTVHLFHDSDNMFTSELNNIGLTGASTRRYLRGINRFGQKFHDNINKILKNAERSKDKKYIMKLIKNYKALHIPHTRRFKDIGDCFHPKAEDLSQLFFSSIDVLCLSEAFINHPKSLHQADTLLVNKGDFESIVKLDLLLEIGFSLEDLKRMSGIIIDYTSLSEKENRYVFYKISKPYAQDDRPLFIVIYGRYNNKDSKIFNEVKKKVNNHKNCRLITLDQYLDLFKFSVKYRGLFTELDRLTVESLSEGRKGDKAFQKLQDFYVGDPNLL